MGKVKLPTLNCWSANSLSRIGSTLGVPLCADDCTSTQSLICLVEMDVTKALPGSITIMDDSGVSFEQKVLYDWTPHSVRSVKLLVTIVRNLSLRVVGRRLR